MKKRTITSIYLLSAIALGLAFYKTGVNAENIFVWLKSFESDISSRVLLSAICITLGLTVAACLSFPAMPLLYMAAGYLFGTINGVVIGVVASSVGGFLACLLYKTHVADSIHEKISRIKYTSPWLLILGLRLSPITPSPLANICAAAYNVAPLPFFVATSLGVFPMVWLYSDIGSSFNSTGNLSTENAISVTTYIFTMAASVSLISSGPWKSIIAIYRTGSKQSLLDHS